MPTLKAKSLLLPNPHFVYNTLNLIQTYIQEGDKLGGMTHVSRFARLMRLWMLHAAREQVSLSAEATLLSTYLGMEQSRFDGSFSYKVELLAQNAQLVWVKPLAWYTAVEQALYARILPAESPMTLRATFTLIGGKPVCVVSSEALTPGKSGAEQITIALRTVKTKRRHATRHHR